MVSGSVCLELLARGKPAIVIYHVTPFAQFMFRWFVTCRYMTLLNLIAGRELMPEFLFARNVEKNVRKMTGQLDEWLIDPSSLAQVRGDIEELRATVAQTGGIARAAEAVLGQLGHEQATRTAA